MLIVIFAIRMALHEGYMWRVVSSIQLRSAQNAKMSINRLAWRSFGPSLGFHCHHHGTRNINMIFRSFAKSDSFGLCKSPVRTSIPHRASIFGLITKYCVHTLSTPSQGSPVKPNKPRSKSSDPFAPTLSRTQYSTLESIGTFTCETPVACCEDTASHYELSHGHPARRPFYSSAASKSPSPST